MNCLNVKMLLVLVIFVINSVSSQGFGQRSLNQVIEKNAFCDSENIYFTVTFQRRFNGIIYTDGTYGSPQCQYVDGTTNPRTSYNVTISLSRCASERLADGTSRNTLIIQRDARILEVHDNKFILTCNPANDANGQPFPNQFTVTLGGVTVGGQLASTNVISNNGGGPNGLKIDYATQVQMGRGPTGQPVTRALNIGEEISYVVVLRNLRLNQARLGRCWATDQISNIQLSDDSGCTSQPSTVWGNFEQITSGSDVVLFNSLKAWAFPTSTRVNIFCNLHACHGSCQQRQCSAGIRKKEAKTMKKEAVESLNHHADMEEPFQFVHVRRRRRNMGANLTASIDAILPQPTETSDMDVPDDIVTMEGSFEVMRAFDDETLEVKAQAAKRLVETAALVTGNPFEAIRGEDAEGEPAKGEICVSHANFVVGVTLVCAVMLLALVITGVVIYKVRDVEQKER